MTLIEAHFKHLYLVSVAIFSNAIEEDVISEDEMLQGVERQANFICTGENDH